MWTWYARIPVDICSCIPSQSPWSQSPCAHGWWGAHLGSTWSLISPLTSHINVNPEKIEPDFSSLSWSVDRRTLLLSWPFPPKLFLLCSCRFSCPYLLRWEACLPHCSSLLSLPKGFLLPGSPSFRHFPSLMKNWLDSFPPFGLCWLRQASIALTVFLAFTPVTCSLPLEQSVLSFLPAPPTSWVLTHPADRMQWTFPSLPVHLQLLGTGLSLQSQWGSLGSGH